MRMTLPIPPVRGDQLLEVLPVNRCDVDVVMQHYRLAAELDCHLTEAAA